MSTALCSGDWSTAEDLVQRTWLKGQAGVATFRGEVPFLVWMRTICRNCHRDELRCRRREAQIVQGSTDAHTAVEHHSHLASRGFEDQQTVNLDLRKALAKLGDGEREAFLLVKGAGYSSLEVAEMLGVAASTVRDRLTRARKKLAASLRAYR